ncbi:MAG TPA: serine--tRNA ligase, partial [Haliea salexigens]|nr:serine--tRNA ligase [Haliea salexigens]
MLDIKAVRQDPQAIAAQLARRGFTFDVAAFEALDAQRKQADMDSQSLLAERKRASKTIGQLVGQGMSVDDAKAQVNLTLDKIAAQLDTLTDQARDVQARLEEFMLGVPNLLAPEVPEGTREEDNTEVARFGEPRVFDFPVRDHVEIGEALQQLDVETAGKITGSRFTVMYGPLARLHRALIQFMLNLHTGEHGYREIY